MKGICPLVKPLATLPHKLHPALHNLGNRLDHGRVEREGAQTAAYQQDCLLVGVQPEELARLVAGQPVVTQILPHRVAGEHDFIGRKEALHTLVGHADGASLRGQQFVGDTRIGVLLLNEGRYSPVGCRPQCGTAGIATYPHGHVGIELAHNAPGQTQTLAQAPQHLEVGHRSRAAPRWGIPPPAPSPSPCGSRPRQTGFRPRGTGPLSRWQWIWRGRYVPPFHRR